MTLNKRWILSLCLMLVLLLAACGGGESSSEGTSDGGGETTENTETTDNTGGDEVTEPEVEVVEEVASTEEALDFSNAKTLDEIAEINSFRLRVKIQAEGDAFEEEEGAAALASGIDIEGAFVKEPAAQHITMSLGGDEGLGTLEFIQSGDKGYTKFGEDWIESPVEEAPQIDDLAFLTPADLAEGLDELERIGDTETVNGRETIHLHADKETLAKLNTGDEDIGIDQAEEVNLDLWYDKTNGFIVKMEIVAAGKGLSDTNAEAEGRVQMTLEYYDFNEEITIDAPEISG